MARYLVQIPRDSLSEQRKMDLVRAITKVHGLVPGNRASEVHIAITETDAGCFFSGGRVIERDHAFQMSFCRMMTK